MGTHPADHPGPMVFVDDLAALVLSDADAHHLRRVLRVRPGDAITVSDGLGAWQRARFGDELEPTGDVERTLRAEPELTVAFALVKGDKPELAVQKLTELGIDRIVPFRADRSVVRWEADKQARAQARLAAVARSAAAQSHRPWIPVVEPVADLRSLAARPGAALADRGGAPPSLDHPVVLVGPEGGWSDEERGHGLPTVSLGPAVLRAETAALTAGALLTALRAGLVGRMA
jgi:16S rRNA (uracil1498-N3)-methyltransferase